MKLSKNLKQKHQESNWVGSKKVPEMEWKKKNYGGSQNSKSNGLEWSSAKVVRWYENREGSRLTPCALTGIRVSIQWSPSNLCSTHPNYKHFAGKRGNSCLDLVPTKCLKGRPSYFWKKTMRNKKQKSPIQSGDMQKLKWFFMERQNTDSVLKEFRCVFILLAMAERDGRSWCLCYTFSFYYMNLYDLPLCIVNNDNLMTFGGHVVYLWPE